MSNLIGRVFAHYDPARLERFRVLSVSSEGGGTALCRTGQVEGHKTVWNDPHVYSRADRCIRIDRLLSRAYRQVMA